MLRSGEILRDLFKQSKSWRPLTDHELEQLKKVMLDISDDFVKLCEENHLEYCMAYGTALGAVRHKGYIPWDDDVDFFMPRADYQRFMKIAETALGDKYYFKSVAKGDKVKFPTLHMRKKNTCYVNYGDLVLTDQEPIEERGIYIDIAPLDNSSDSKFIRNFKAYISLAILFCASCVTVMESVRFAEKNNIKISESDYKAMRFKTLLGKILALVPMHNWMRMYDRLCAGNHNDKSEYLISYCGLKSIMKGTYLRTDMLPFERGCFEGRMWYLPRNADAYLTTEYNDYMTIPKQENQKIHPVFFLDFNGVGNSSDFFQR